MKNKLLLIVGVLTFLGGAFVGIERRTVNPINGQSHVETRLLLPGQEPKFEQMPGGGTSFSTVRYAYGLMSGGFIDPNHIEAKLEVRAGHP